jgi:hypothetical protein
MIKKWILKLLVWILGYDPVSMLATSEKIIEELQKTPKDSILIPPSVMDIMNETIKLCVAHEGNQSGEWKRHQVLAKLMKHGAAERDAALAIELAVRMP